jgi:hypothetical protein
MDPPASSIPGDGCVVHSTLAIDPALLHQTCRGCFLGLHQQPQEQTRIGNGQPGRGDQDAGLCKTPRRLPRLLSSRARYTGLFLQRGLYSVLLEIL